MEVLMANDATSPSTTRVMNDITRREQGVTTQGGDEGQQGGLRGWTTTQMGGQLATT